MAENRGLKTRANLSSTIDRKLYESLNDLHDETRIPKSKLLDEAIQLLLNKHGIERP